MFHWHKDMTIFANYDIWACWFTGLDVCKWKIGIQSLGGEEGLNGSCTFWYSFNHWFLPQFQHICIITYQTIPIRLANSYNIMKCSDSILAYLCRYPCPVIWQWHQGTHHRVGQGLHMSHSWQLQYRLDSRLKINISIINDCMHAWIL
jgi:hypothetical protein